MDTRLFRPDRRFDYSLPKPVWMYLGRVAVEKNIEAFLGLDLPGSKVIIGDGPDRARLARRFIDCHFLGYRFGEDLARRLEEANRHLKEANLSLKEIAATDFSKALAIVRAISQDGFRTWGRINRLEGGLLLGGYLAYQTLLYFTARS